MVLKYISKINALNFEIVAVLVRISKIVKLLNKLQVCPLQVANNTYYAVLCLFVTAKNT